MEFVDYHWEIFLWGDPPIKPINDFDLNVPNTWFEYETVKKKLLLKNKF